jgi:hypothetical protein
MTKDQIYYMPKHGKLWIVTEVLNRDVTLEGECSYLPCKLATLEWLLSIGTITLVGELN